MRQVFRSQRLENVEAVAELLRAEGIEVRISDGRSYRGNRRSQFSYRERADGDRPQPAVWVVRAEDQPRARQLLRAAGLLESTREGEGRDSYLPPSARAEADPARPRRGLAFRVRLVLLGLIALVIALLVYETRRAPAPARAAAAPAAAPARPSSVPEAIESPQPYRAEVPTALALLLAERAHAAAAPPPLCLTVDGAAPSARLAQALAAAGLDARPATACPEGAGTRLAIREYVTDGSGEGTVQLQLGDAPPQRLAVRREGTHWQILAAAAAP